MAYIRCLVRPYIPNPLRCFQCQRFGHSKTVCRGQPTCSRCAEVGHDSADCKAKERCVNCKGDHSSFSRSCPTWLLEKEITAVKIKDKIRIRRLGVLYRHARQFLEKAMRRRPENIHINGHSSRREYGSNICDSRNYDTEECCRVYT
ncbi:CCHC-type domain-containing protein [Trichonephila clavipes]|nr:CCHC-type domain-containing protein [Trichonephila clavipes]